MNCVYCEKWGVSRNTIQCDDALGKYCRFGKYCREKCGWNPDTPRGSVCMEIRLRIAGGALPEPTDEEEEDEHE